MWLRWLCGFGMLASCAANPVERKQLADGSWRITCQLPMDACVRQLEIVCPEKRYRILGGQSQRELRDVEPVVRESRTSELTAVCDHHGGDALFGGTATSTSLSAPVGSAPVGAVPWVVGSVTPPVAAAPAASTTAPALPKACVPGSTQACVGTAGCAGGQTCRSDGSGFGACDCGPARAPSTDAGL